MFGVLLRKEVFPMARVLFPSHAIARSHIVLVPETTAKAQLVVGLGTKAFSLIYLLCHAHLTGSEAYAFRVEH